jgi:uncharacterized protein YlaI
VPDDTTGLRPVPEREDGSSARRHIIRAIPTIYRGTCFRSRLEARWAATFDQLGMYWEYEPDGVEIDGVRYLCDFRLPKQHCWFEVKGPTNDRLDKVNHLRKALPSRDLVIVGRPAGPGGRANWQGVDTDNVGIFTCKVCHRSCFLNPLRSRKRKKPIADWRCRNCDVRRAIDPFSRIDSAAFIEAHPLLFSAGIVRGLTFATLPASGST